MKRLIEILIEVPRLFLCALLPLATLHVLLHHALFRLLGKLELDIRRSPDNLELRDPQIRGRYGDVGFCVDCFLCHIIPPYCISTWLTLFLNASRNLPLAALISLT